MACITGNVILMGICTDWNVVSNAVYVKFILNICTSRLHYSFLPEIILAHLKEGEYWIILPHRKYLCSFHKSWFFPSSRTWSFFAGLCKMHLHHFKKKKKKKAVTHKQNVLNVLLPCFCCCFSHHFNLHQSRCVHFNGFLMRRCALWKMYLF